MKKLLAVLLSLCLVVGMLPMMAFATDDEITTTPTEPTTQETPPTTEPTKSEDPDQDGSGGTVGSGGKGDPGSTVGSGAKPPEEPTTTEPEENEPSYEVKVEHGAYNVNSIRSQKELQNALDKKEPTLKLGSTIDLTSDLKLDYNVKKLIQTLK